MGLVTSKAEPTEEFIVNYKEDINYNGHYMLSDLKMFLESDHSELMVKHGKISYRRICGKWGRNHYDIHSITKVERLEHCIIIEGDITEWGLKKTLITKPNELINPTKISTVNIKDNLEGIEEFMDYLRSMAAS